MSDDEIVSILRERLAKIEQRIQSACDRVSRPREDVRLVAVTKTIGLQVARLLPQLGLRDLGENRPQELKHKADAIADVNWHMIGHLQRNKAAVVVSRCQWIHSMDSSRLMTALREETEQQNRFVSVLLQFNISGEQSKQGLSPDTAEVRGILVVAGPGTIQGLMTMAPFDAEPEATRPVFRGLRQLRDQLQQRYSLALPELSMGMSNDFEIAIEEGATMIRLGSVLFEGLPGDEP